MSRSDAEPRLDPARLGRLSVIYEDADILAVAKPPGLSVHGGAGEPGPTVLGLLSAAYAPAGGPALHLAHRLDRGTSGVLLLAKGRDVLQRVVQGWDRAEKEYLAAVVGAYDGPALIDRPLVDDRGVSRPARTQIEVLGTLRGLPLTASVLRVVLRSGRTHQVRLHLQGAGHPVLFDDRHGDFAANKAWTRMLRERGARPPKKGELLLHARRLSFIHPERSEALELVAPLPETWVHLLQASSPEGWMSDFLPASIPRSDPR